MSDDARWLSTDHVNKVFLPVATLLLSSAVFFGTRETNAADRESKARAQCREGTIKLLDDAEKLIASAPEAGSAPATPNAKRPSALDPVIARGRRIDVSSQFLVQDCKTAKIAVPLNVQRMLCTVREIISDTEIRDNLARTGDEIVEHAGRPDQSGCSAGDEGADAAIQTVDAKVGPGPSRGPASTAAPAPSMTLYIQYPRSIDVAAVNALRRSILADGLAGHNVRVPQPEAVSAPPSSTLRCLKVTDCAYAPDIAAALNAKLANPSITVLDLSSRYESRTDVRQGKFELWLTADATRLRTPPERASGGQAQ